MAQTKLDQLTMIVPYGTTAQRPGNPTANSVGLFRFNTDLGVLEYSNNSQAWVGVGLFTATSTGTVTSITGYQVHTFTSNGTFTTGPFAGAVQVLIVGSGGSGGADVGGGGGGGGVIYSSGLGLNGNTAYTVNVGSGVSTPNTQPGSGNNGNPSTFAGLTAYGGGWGGYWQNGNGGNPGGCGGGGTGYNPSYGSSANYGSGTPGQGYPGGYGSTGGPIGDGAGGGGGGAGGAGGNASGGVGGSGGVGYQSNISGTSYYYGGGAGGVDDAGNPNASNGTPGTGGGGVGGGSATYYGGGAGGIGNNTITYSYQGIVIIKFVG
jgi:hypothetical protein